MAASELSDQWHHDQSAACRHVMGTRQFLVSQLANRDCLKTMHDVLGKLESNADLAYVGFTIPEEVLVIASMHTCTAVMHRCCCRWSDLAVVSGSEGDGDGDE